jgi:hydroxymethylglutaryl-CoA synthase
MPPTTSAAQESEPLHPDTMRQAQLLAPSVSTFDPVGILAIEVYFPRKYVDQRALESFDGVTPGKYTIGLGQQAMSFCGDREDVRSMCMTVVQTLMEKYRIEYNDIGRLEVGTETIIDRAKSIKTALMSLFEQSGNFEVEGIDSTNACYAGTNALFNTIAWCESCTLFDGRFGLVVCGDIAVYPRGPARATGGAGAVALLIGRAQPQRYPQLEPILVLEPGLKSSHFENTWDFFKPARRQDTEYPIVNGTESIACYFRALDICYTRFTGRVEQQTRRTRVWLAETSGRPGAEQVTEQQSLRCTLLTSTAFAEPSVTPVADADATQLDYVVFHAPFNKLVCKSFARLVLNDYLRYPELASQHRAVSGALRAQLAKLKRLPAHLNPTGVCVPPPSTYWDRTLMQLLLECSEPLYRAKCAPSTTLARQTGNAYTASLFGNLLCLLDAERDRTLGKRVVLFGFGSGMAASMYAMRVVASPEALLRRVGLIERLGARIPTSPACFHETLRLREQNYGACDYEPSEPLEELFPGTYYLVRIDGRGIRYYDRYQGSRASDQAACCNALCPDKP